MLDPRLLRMFLTVAEERSFARAADGLGLAQSSVSAQMKRLEDVIGAPLLTRGKRAAVHLTEVGRLFVGEARAALEGLDRAETLGRMAARGLAGPVTIGYIFSAVTNGTLPHLLRSARTAAPMVHVAASLSETPDLIAGVTGRRIDIALIRPRPAYPEGVVARTVHAEPLIMLTGPDHPLAAHAAISVEMLSEQRFLLPQFNERTGLLENLERLARAGGFAMPEVIRTGDFVTAASLAAAGYGVVLAPASLARLGVDGLTARPIRGFADQIETAMIWHEQATPAVHRILGSEDHGGRPSVP